MELVERSNPLEGGRWSDDLGRPQASSTMVLVEYLLADHADDDTEGDHLDDVGDAIELLHDSSFSRNHRGVINIIIA